MRPFPIATVLLLRADVVRRLPADFMWSFCTMRHGPRNLAGRAVASAIHGALAELVRQVGPLDPQILKEAHGAGLAAAQVFLDMIGWEKPTASRWEIGPGRDR